MVLELLQFQNNHIFVLMINIFAHNICWHIFLFFFKFVFIVMVTWFIIWNYQWSTSWVCLYNVNISNHCGWIIIVEFLYNDVMRRPCNGVIIRFGCTSPIKCDDLYFICLFNDKLIVGSSCGRWSNIDWVELTFKGTFMIFLFILYCP